jgi:membrane protein implicated in regulation of membrane protease activity
MSAVAGTFLAIGGVALLLLIMSIFGARLHLGHLHFGHFHLGHWHFGGHPASGSSGFELSLPVISGFLGAFGFGGAIVASLVPGHTTTAWLAASLIGLVAALPSAWLAGRMMHAAMNMPTDATLTSDDLLGAAGVVISPVPAGGLGEVRIAVAGQQMKFHARADQPLALGTRVFVIAVPSPTSVLVEPTPGHESIVD